MTGANEQIVVAFEENGLTPEQIAEQLEYDLTAVKAILFQNSSVYRKEAKTDSKLQFSLNEREEMKSIILNIARYSEDESLQFKAATYVHKDGESSIDKGTGPQTMNFNIVSLMNDQLKKALAAQSRVTRTAEVIEVKS